MNDFMKKNINKNEHCCYEMAMFLEDAQVPIYYDSRYREYHIPFSNYAAQGIEYCPWCGKRLPKSFRDKYFEILETEYRIDDVGLAQDNNTLPEEFNTDKWWKKRKLRTRNARLIKRRDILKELYENKIDEKQAETHCKKVMKKDLCIISDLLGLDLHTEYRARAVSGLSLKILAKWRYEGWPSCCICCESVDFKKDKWLAQSKFEIGNATKENVLIHLDCLAEIQEYN